ncbi:hypothetical protein MSG28_001353 [Choristoneura fumiferana]|uniref:Uncharacterized protein n=1 Tax=Choristoneura fumiferana TaxID=7141 RepID=A0ACC0KTV7_CHOFU|nr:hypothetical protein MSG28_001353 [Choristoneura fumiferana]
MKYIVWFILTILVFISNVMCIDPLVLTENGLVQGFEADDGKFANFLGIPYAKIDEDNPFGSYYDLPTTSMDNMIIYRMTTMWTGFAKTSNPTPQANELLPFTWHSSAGQAEPSYAVLNEFVRMQQLPYFRRMAFWDAFFALYENKTRW